MQNQNQIVLREYQKNILKTCLEKNTLVILPTGTGKTIIAFFVILERLKQYPDKKIFFLAPTKPLTNQHYKNFIKFFPEYKERAIAITGEARPERREYLYKMAQIIFITPQTLQNDLINGKVSFYNASTIVFDEAHRAVKKYPYVFIAKKFVEQAENPKIIGLTASPGWKLERIQEVINNLFINAIEIRTGKEPDIKSYIKQIIIEKVEINLSPELEQIKKLLEDAIRIRLEKVKDLIDISKLKGKKHILEALEEIRKELAMKPKDIKIKEAVILLGEIIKIEHALELLETQTLYTFLEYMKELEEKVKISKSRSLKNVIEDIRIRKAYFLAKQLLEKGIENPKIFKLLEIIKENKDKKIIIFAQIRKTVDRIKKYLDEIGIKSEKFIGKKEMNQAEQLKILKRFSEGYFNVLIATSIGEEGIDIPKVDLVIFYEPVPSEIRYIQRRGRTGRTDIGKVIILMTKGTRDERFFWVAVTKERKMLKFIKQLKKYLKPSMIEVSPTERTDIKKKDKVEESITKFLSPQKKEENVVKKKTVPVIIADYREKDSGLVQTLAEMGVIVQLENLEVGDYIVGDLVIERKTIIDFIKSLLDKRLFNQLEKLKDKKAIIVLEGEEDLLTETGINPNYMRSVLLKIVLEYKIPIIRTKNFVDTANYIYILAKNSEEISIPTLEKKQIDLNKVKIEILKQIPGIGETLAKKLLERFKTLKNIVLAPKVELEKVIGESKAEKLKKVFEEEFKTE